MKHRMYVFNGRVMGLCVGCQFDTLDRDSPLKELFMGGLCMDCLPATFAALTFVVAQGGQITLPNGTYDLSFDVSYGMRKAMRAGWLTETAHETPTHTNRTYIPTQAGLAAIDEYNRSGGFTPLAPNASMPVKNKLKEKKIKGVFLVQEVLW